MDDNRINALFLTQNDCSFAYKMRTNLVDMNCDVFYINSFKDLINKIIFIKSSIIFVDDKNIEDLHVIARLLDTELFASSLLVYVGKDTNIVKMYGNNSNFFYCTSDQASVSLYNIINQYKLKSVSKPVNFNKEKLNNELNAYLTKLGMTQKWIGFKFIKECLWCCITNNFTMGSLITEVYPTVAAKNNTSPSNVERSIRNAICKAFSITQFKSSGFEEFTSAKKITNRLFLACILDKISQSQNDEELQLA